MLSRACASLRFPWARSHARPLTASHSLLVAAALAATLRYNGRDGLLRLFRRSGCTLAIAGFGSRDPIPEARRLLSAATAPPRYTTAWRDL
eukprot:366106-Chlamydomonas_euryale.AAC.11